MSCGPDTTYLFAPLIAAPIAAFWGASRARGSWRVWLAPFLWGGAGCLMAMLMGTFVAELLPQEPCMDTLPYDGPPPLTDSQVAFNTLTMLALGGATPLVIARLHKHRNVAQLWLLATMPLAYVLVAFLGANLQGLTLWIWLAGVVGWLGCLPGWIERLVTQPAGQPSVS